MGHVASGVSLYSIPERCGGNASCAPRSGPLPHTCDGGSPHGAQHQAKMHPPPPLSSLWGLRFLQVLSCCHPPPPPLHAAHVHPGPSLPWGRRARAAAEQAGPSTPSRSNPPAGGVEMQALLIRSLPTLLFPKRPLQTQLPRMPPDAPNWTLWLPASLLPMDPCHRDPAGNSPEHVPAPVPRQWFP